MISDLRISYSDDSKSGRSLNSSGLDLVLLESHRARLQ